MSDPVLKAYMDSFNLHNSIKNYYFPHQTEKENKAQSNLPKVIQLVSDRARAWIQAKL